MDVELEQQNAQSDRQDQTSDDELVRGRGIQYLESCVRATAQMGAASSSGVIYSAMGKKIKGIPDERYWERSSMALKKVAQFAANMGVIIGIEPVNRYMIDEPNVAIHLDAYYMNIEENNFYEPTKKAAPYLCHYHLSESHRGTPGKGTVNWADIYRALSECNYSGTVGLESFAETSDAMRTATCKN